ncbi:MAG: cadherin domain-containing protein, partial [Sphingomonas sp.]|uniref:cadherin domain-containing protein n=1 Tax=Sphingomonas sp. TaxID=28214 RepID=UPI0025D603C6
DPATGEVRFKAAPDYETPRDRDGDNIYSIIVHASDGSIASSRPVTIAVTNQNEAPTGFFIQAATPLNHIANGSFEHFTEGTVSGIANGGYFNPVATGWETTSGSIDIVADGYVSPEGTWRGSDGRYQLELASATSNGTIRQTISGLRAGETYSLSFDRAGQVGQGTTIVEVVWNGQVVGTYDSTGQFSSWTHEQLNLTAAAGDNVLEFREIGADGNWAATRLDNVSLVSRTPELSINENAAAGTLVATLGGRDADAGETFTYALLDDAGGRFVIDPATGRITVAPGATIDFESTPNLSITARVTDSAGQSFDQTIAIAVNNEATTLAGTAGADTLTGTAEEDMLLGYDGNDILRGGMGNDFINGGAGNDIAVFSGDRSQYLITRDAQGRVTVADLVNGRDGTDIVVNVEQLRFANGTFSTLAAANPDNVAPTGFTIQASTPLNHIVNGSFENFSGGIIWYGDNYAYITPKATGWQTTAGTIDIVANNYSGGLGYWTTTDGKYQVELASSTTNGTIRQSIDGLKAGDTYTLSFDRSGHVNQGNTIVQVIWNGVVVGTYDSTGQFSTWTHEQLNLTAAAGANVLEFREIGTDGNWAATRLDNVSLVAAAPELSINENATGGTVVGTLTGIDANAGDSLTYALLDDAGGRFAIDATTGRITVANGAVIDYESTTSLAITVRVTDAAGLTHDERITIGVNNEMATYAGTTAADTLIGDREENNLLGYEGDDTLRGNGGNDLLDGGAGTDIAVFTGNRADYDFRLNADGQVVVTDRVADRDGTDILVNIEQVKFADGTFNLVVNNGSSPSLSGTISGDYMVGNSSSETISGGEGNDVLVGGPSADNLSGGPGHDVIVLGLADGSDVVSGGTGGGWIDTIELHDVGAPTAPTGWYVELGDGTQLAAHTATGTFETGNDASGTIHFADGHTVNFDGIERISWV